MAFHHTISLLLISATVGTRAATRIGKSTYACSEKAATNAYAWEMKYLPVDEADDDCPSRTCTCGKQSRVALKTSGPDDAPLVGAPQGFGIHCTYAAGKDGTRAAANGGTSESEIEARVAMVIGNWSTYDTDANVRAWASYSTSLYAQSGLDWYVAAFKNDSVAHHLGSWDGSLAEGGKTYWSLLVLIPGTSVVLEIHGTCTVCGDPTDRRMPRGWHHATPSGGFKAAKNNAAAEQGILTATTISRFVDNLTVVRTFYKSVFAIDPVNETTLSDGASVADYQPGGTAVTVRYVQRAVSGKQSASWFQTLLLDTATKYQTSPGACWPIWGDYHYGGQFGSGTILSHVTAASKLGFPYRSFAGGAGPSNAYFLEPSGMWIQDGGDSTGLPSTGGFSTSYCYTFCNATAAAQ